MKPVILLLFSICFNFPHPTISKNILVWGAVGMHSIRISMTPFMEALADNDHNVTYLTVFDDFEKSPNKTSKISTFVPKKWKEVMGSWENGEDTFYDVRKTFFGVAKTWYDLRSFGVLACESLYSDPEFIEWVKTSPKYDLVVVELTLSNECAYSISHHFGAKLAIYSTTSVVPDFLDGFGLPDESSSISDITLGFPSGKGMSFFHRFLSAINPIIYRLTKDYVYMPKLEEIAKRGYKLLGKKEEDVPSFSEVERNASLVYLTTHFSLDYPRSLPPNVVQIGGTVITKSMKPMDDEMKIFLDSATNGFVYISFGSVIEFSTFDKLTQEEFVNALYDFPQVKFLWKAANGINMTLPDNILVTPWAPQQAVLAHPNIKAFVTHSGMGGTTEAIHFSVPMICFPVCADQDQNAQIVQSKGAGIKLELIGLRKEHLRNAIWEILHDKKYQLAMNKLTRIFNDRPMPPLENAIWWTEYILRHDNINDFILSPSAH